MRFAPAATLCLALALPGHAGPSAEQPLIDFDLLLDQTADHVETGLDKDGKPVRRLDFGPVHVYCNGAEGADCIAIDPEVKSVLDLGCAVAVMASLTTTAARCEGTLTPAQTLALTERFALLTQLVAERSLPALEVEHLRDVLLRGARPLGACAQLPAIAATLMSPQMDAAIKTRRSEPSSTPVVTRCAPAFAPLFP